MKPKVFKTSEDGIRFFEDFALWKATSMSDYYYNKLEKAGELDVVYKKKNEILWDMFGDWEMAADEIMDDIHSLRVRYDLQTEKAKVEYLNEMLEWYDWYLQYN